MANRYWVGGSGTWNTTSTTNWSASSGGASGASVPTATDSVFFDQAGTYTVTMTGALTCLDFTVSAGTVTFATGTTPSLTVSGSFTLLAGGTWSSTSSITFNATTTGKTVTTNGVTMGGLTVINFNGVGGGWTLGSAITMNATGAGIAVTNGTFDTGNFNVTIVGSFASSNSNTRTVNFGSSTVTMTGNGGNINFLSSTNLTFNAGTSTVVFSGNSGGLTGGGKTFYNASWTSTTATAGSVAGSNTFNNLSITARASAGVNNFTFATGTTQTINGTFTVSGGTATNRTIIQNNTIGSTAPILNCAAVSLTDVDFISVTIGGAASPASGTRVGNGGNNSGITFDTPKTVYWNLAAGTDWSNTAWAATSGGSPAVANFPLAQDTAVFEATGLNSGSTVAVSSAYILGTVNMSARTANTMALNLTTNVLIAGDMICGSGGRPTSTASVLIFMGGGTQNITSAGSAWSAAILINSAGGTVKLLDAFASSSNISGAITLSLGTFNANGFNVTLSGTAGTFVSTGSGTRTLTIGSGTWSIVAVGGLAWSTASTGLTVTASTGTIKMTGATAKTFGGSSKSWPTLDQGGAGALTINGSNTFADITNSRNATGAATIIFLAGTTNTLTAFTATGTVGNVLTIQSTVAGSAATLSKSSGTVSVDYMSIKDSTATGGASWYAGANSTNVSGNTGWIFTAPPTYAIGGQFMAFF